jgi:hypothetical protein
MDKKKTSSSTEKELEDLKELTAKEEEAQALKDAEQMKEEESKGNAGTPANKEQAKPAPTAAEEEARPSETMPDTSGDNLSAGPKAADVAPKVWKTPTFISSEFPKSPIEVVVSRKGGLCRWYMKPNIIKTYQSRSDFEDNLYVHAAAEARKRMYALGNLTTKRMLIGNFDAVVNDPSPWADPSVGEKLKEFIPTFAPRPMGTPAGQLPAAAQPGPPAAQVPFVPQRVASTLYDLWNARMEDPGRQVLKVETNPDDPIKRNQFVSFSEVYEWQLLKLSLADVMKLIVKPEVLAGQLNQGWQPEHYVVNGDISEANTAHPYYIVAPQVQTYAMMRDLMQGGVRVRRKLFLKLADQVANFYYMTSNDSTKIAATLKSNTSENLMIQNQSTYVPQFLGATAASQLFTILVATCAGHNFQRFTANFRGRSTDPTALLGALSYITFVPPLARDRRSQADAGNCIFQFLSMYTYTMADSARLIFRMYVEGGDMDRTAPIFGAGAPVPPRTNARLNCNLGYPDLSTFLASVPRAVLRSSPLWEIFLNIVAPGSYMGTLVRGNGARGSRQLFEQDPVTGSYAVGLDRMMNFLEAVSSMVPNRAQAGVASQVRGYSEMLRAYQLEANLREYFWRVTEASAVLASVSIVPLVMDFEPDPYQITEPLAILGMVLGIDYAKCFIKDSYFSQMIQHRAEIWDLSIVDGLGSIIFADGAISTYSNKHKVAIWEKMVMPYQDMFMSEWVSANWKELIMDWRPRKTTDDRFYQNTGIANSPKALTLQWVGLLSAGSSLAVAEGVLERAVWGISDIPARLGMFRNDTSAEIETVGGNTQFEGRDLVTYNSYGVRLARAHSGLPAGGLPAPIASAAFIQYDYTGDPATGRPPFTVRPPYGPKVPWLKMELQDNSMGSTIQGDIPGTLDSLRNVVTGAAPIVKFVYSWEDSTTVFNDYTGQLAVLRPTSEDLIAYFQPLQEDDIVRGIPFQFIMLDPVGKQDSLQILTISPPIL